MSIEIFTSNDIRVPCPGCGSIKVISHKNWMATVKAERDKTEKQREEEMRTGKIEVFTCAECQGKYPAADWHRQYERQEFAARGWTTGRMA